MIFLTYENTLREKKNEKYERKRQWKWMVGWPSLVFHIRKENNKKSGMKDKRRRLDEKNERKS